MKNIQVIDGADNCVYDIYQVSDEDLNIIFPIPDQNIEFIEDFEKRVGTKLVKDLNERIWMNRIPKSLVNGIHGTLFFQMEHKKKYYLNKIDSDN